MSVLRPARWSDIPWRDLLPDGGFLSMMDGLSTFEARMVALETLYDAEWRKRGFLRSP